MANNPAQPAEASPRAPSELSRLRTFSGPPSEFWPAFLGATAGLAGARQAVLLLKAAPPASDWKKLGQWQSDSSVDRFSLSFTKQLAELAAECARDGGLARPVEPGARQFAAGVVLQLPKPDDTCVMLFLLADAGEARANEVLFRLQLVADTPVLYHRNQQAAQARTDVDKFVGALDTMAQVNAETRFVAAALAFCNAIAARHHCERASLGWLTHGYVRLQTISRTEKFDRNMAVVKAMEIAMEEALDQDAEIVFPAGADAAEITRDHSAYAREQGIGFICSTPLRLDGEGVAVLTCERQSGAFTEEELRQLRLACDQAARRLADLKRLDRWFGARWSAAAREKLAGLVGTEHTWAKFLAVLGGVALVLALVIKINYRVEANFVLRSDEVAYLTAPFDGYIRRVDVRAGDALAEGKPLLRLATEDLELEQAAAVAEVARYRREAEKARATGALGDMGVALALAQQSQARLDLARYRIGQAELRAPFSGVVIEGDQRERIGAPVKQGEVLFKVGNTAKLYVEADVSEKDIHEIRAGAGGQIAFASQPRLKFPISVTRIQAAAEAKETGSVFLVREAVAGSPPPWWRPGMSGVTKINVGPRPLIWILTHRTIDYLRLLLWW